MKTYIRRQQHKFFFKHQDIKQKEPPQKYRLGTISNTKLLAGFDEGVAPDLWSVVDNLYSDMSKIKWHGQLSEKFSIQQGVRQGSILSSHLYKMYVSTYWYHIHLDARGSRRFPVSVKLPGRTPSYAQLVRTILW